LLFGNYKFAFLKLKNITGNIFLLPLSWLYGAITGVRNFLYNYGILKSVKFDIPVICVGNIAAGGTGKTPFSAYLIEKLYKDYKTALLSRGYKRKSKGFVLADDESTALIIGDEPRLLKRKYPELVVAVDADRVEGITKIRQLKPETEMILLDDGFQHRRVDPGCKILLTDYGRLYSRDHILPYGMLRESRRAYARADMVVVTKCPDNITGKELQDIADELKILPHQSLFFAGWEYAPLYSLFGKHCLTDDDIKNKEIVLMTGIASPAQAVSYLKSVTAGVQLFQFPDHHYFSREDYKQLADSVTQHNEIVKTVVVTEKDAARIESDKWFPDRLKEHIYVLPVKMKVLQNKEDALIKRILDHVRTN
jgi:tetraacyldisaccharide 4'-kinase